MKPNFESFPSEQIIEAGQETDVGSQAGGNDAVDVEKTKDRLINPRTISKKTDQKGRSEMVQTIVETRNTGREALMKILQVEGNRDETDEQYGILYTAERQKTEELTARLESTLVKVKGLIGLGDKQAQQLQAEIDQLSEAKESTLAEFTQIEEELDSLRATYSELPEPRQMLEAYYEEMSVKPLTNEQKREMLRPEVLETLSEDEYIALWRRLNPHFLTHVTRQGFRDHNAMFYHSAGLQEFHNGFMSVVEDDKTLRPPIALQGLRGRDEQSVREFLGSWVLEAEDEDEAQNRLYRLLNSTLASAPNYPDKTAVHFAAELVADGYYGGESGNEVFFVYPSDVLASQHEFAFNGWEKDFTRPQSETKWNDVFIWPEDLEDPEISVDAGFVFLPEDARVDPETGSKYASEIRTVDGVEKRVMVENTALVTAFTEWGKGLDDKSPLKQVFNAYKEERHYNRPQDMQRSCLAAFSEELQTLGFSDEAALALGNKLMGELHWKDELSVEVLRSIIEGSGAHWKRAEATVSSKEYWEAQFSQEPDKRPKHIHYYKGSPTRAILEFQQQHDIGRASTAEDEGLLLGFDDHHIQLNGQRPEDQDERAMRGYNELVETATNIISQHYTIKE